MSTKNKTNGGRSASGSSKTDSVVVWSQSRKCFCQNMNAGDLEKTRPKLVPLRGAIPTLRHLFYPFYTYEGATLVTSHSQKSSVADPEDAKHENAYNKKDNRRWWGTKLGIAIGKQIDKTIVWFNKINCDPRTFFVPAVRSVTSRSITVTKEKIKFDSMVKNLHSFTEKIWATMHKLGIVPVATETIVYSIDMGVATAVDIECRDVKTGEFVLVELKTNYKNRNNCTQNKMQFPFQDLTDSALNQHFLQLMLTYYLYTKTFATRKVSRSYLFRVDDQGVDVDRLPAEFVNQYCQSMVNKILNTVSIRRSSSSTKAKPVSKKRARPVSSSSSGSKKQNKKPKKQKPAG